MRAVDTLFDRATPVCYGIAAVALVGIVLLMNLRILSRNLNLGLDGLQLYAQALAVWMVFVVAGVLGWEDRHIEIDYFTERLPAWAEPYHDIAVDIINLVMCAVLVAGAVLAIEQFWTGTSPSVNIPMPVYYIPVVVGVSMLALVYLVDVGDRIAALATRTRGVDE
jgi:TRAP-type C4-dicarboxylate transport system permease small subunit